MQLALQLLQLRFGSFSLLLIRSCTVLNTTDKLSLLLLEPIDLSFPMNKLFM
jgi:hypothetical protein